MLFPHPVLYTPLLFTVWPSILKKEEDEDERHRGTAGSTVAS